MSMIFLTTGNYTLGCTTRDKDSNIIKQTQPKFEPDDKGGCVIVGKLNPDTMEQIGSADIFGNYNATAYLKKALDLLSPNRAVDVPNFKEMYLNAFLDGQDFCDYCQDCQCNNCIIAEWKEEVEE